MVDIIDFFSSCLA